MTAVVRHTYDTWFPPAPISAAQSRSFVRDVLAPHHTLDDWSDTAQLLVTELVTNAILHAQTIVGVVVTIYDNGVRVGISDSSVAPVTRQRASDTSTTGRGLNLVRLLANDLGVITRSAGKEVWFSLGDVPRKDPGEGDSQRRSESTQQLTLLAVPWLLFLSWIPHAAATVREMLLISLKAHHHRGRVAPESCAEANEAIACLAGAAVAASLASAGTPRTDLALHASPRLTRSFTQLKGVLQLAFPLSVDGSLLVLPAPPEVGALRDWVCDEVARQSAGEPATPCPAMDLTTSWPEKLTPPTFDLDHVTASREAVIAADDHNHILAVSSAATALLGWDPHQLVGQRITVIVPHRLREAHVAGFVLFLLTGKRSLSEGPVTVSALRADGSEVDVQLSISPVATEEGRTVFLARLQPIAESSPTDPPT